MVVLTVWLMNELWIDMFLGTSLNTHISLLQERQDLGNVIKSENTMGGLLESMKLENHLKSCVTELFKSKQPEQYQLR